MEKVFVTGSAGFVGGHLVDELLKKYTVIGIDNMTSGLQKTLESHIVHENFIPALYDVTDPKIERIFSYHNPKYVFHLAAKSGVAPSVNFPIFSDFTNTNGTVRMLELSRKYGVKRLVFSSSSSVYGGSNGSPNSEIDKPNPRSPYALQKLVGEQYCRLYSEALGLDTACLRYFNVIGARQRSDSAYAAVLPAWAVCKKKGLRPKVYGDGLTSRDFCPVEDVVSANILAAEYEGRLEGEVFNVARGKNMSLLHLHEILDLKEPIFEPERPGDVKHSLANIDKIKDVLGYKPMLNIEEVILETAASYL